MFKYYKNEFYVFSFKNSFGPQRTSPSLSSTYLRFMDDLRDTNSRLRHEINLLGRTIDRLTDQEQNLRVETIQEQTENLRLAVNNLNLQKAVDDLKSSNFTVQKMYEDMKGKYEDMKGKYEDMNEKYEKLEKKTCKF
ncbi:unnamed protein product [Rotaria socialis]|uniref:Uncharacterized protein n=1 Tax=Rotaria socialis TaxID=392032 RepID=A0A818CY86_9BILA|nr:unnamed protein product [Rotaria socialis]CAF3344748.1 unnamed protein product [Rotaria socialis]CAF3389816.1 unnamed protein product [Rotaria socialis]CAF3439519.1 unnamed protein product [Rotaria socialis]CAF3611610.1 unnamed protein product [Rotaria socialis]